GSGPKAALVGGPDAISTGPQPGAGRAERFMMRAGYCAGMMLVMIGKAEGLVKGSGTAAVVGGTAPESLAGRGPVAELLMTVGVVMPCISGPASSNSRSQSGWRER